tara:strand:+ start:2034 stop:3365 length:1332 start_codon:yes stop_codon:yes gene_type:complete
MNNVLKDLIKQFMPFAQQHIGFENPPSLFLKNDEENAKNPLGKTAFYDPEEKSVTLFITGRHPKDILRSLGHELVHHKQNCDGEFSDVDDLGPGYAQRDPHLRDMEEKANLHGSMCLRDFEDMLKKENTIYYEHLQKGDKKMSTKDWKNGELTTILSEAFGFKFSLDKLNEAADKNTGMSGVKGDDDDDTYMGHVKEEEELEEGNEQIFAPNHYCVHHGGVEHNGAVQMAEAISHNFDRKLNRVTHYTMKLADGTILENVAAEDIHVTDASLAEGHSHPPGKRDDGESKGDKGKDKDDPKARDYTDGGDRKGDESRTHKGEKDYTTKKDDELKHSGKGRGEKKGDKAYVNEDSGWDEKEHDEHNAWSDEDHIEAIEKHLRALKHDRDYEEDHEELEEAGTANRMENSPGIGQGKDVGRNRASADRTQGLAEAIAKALRKHLKG